MMPPKRLVISEIMSGLNDYDPAFFQKNDAFTTLVNALCWRKRVLKKPGSARLGQVRRSLGNTGASPFAVTISPVPLAHGTSKFTIGSVALVDGDTTAGAVANLTSSDGSYSGTLNRTTGALSIAHPVIAATPVYFYPGIPIMGIEQFESDKSPNTQIDFPENVYFDQTYSYQYDGGTKQFFDVSFYKTSNHPVYWTGANYQQFNSANYYRAMFVTNNKPGMQFVAISAISAAAVAQITTAVNHNLSTGDVVFINETTGTDAANLNMLSFSVTVTGANTFTVPASTAGGINNVGIVQYMTQISPSSTGDGIRWFDGFGSGLGWVNFAPPLDNLASSATTYLMGARILIPFGNRLLAIGTFEATSAAAATPTYYGNRIRYCEVTATPFYANPTPSTSTIGVEARAWGSNIQGFGGFIDLDTTERIISASVTQGNLILGLETEQRRLGLTNVETDPFSLVVINPDYGTAGTNAVIPMDKGIMTFGEYGIMLTSSYDSKRIDLPIIDQVFQSNQNNNGYERICGARDFANEVIYFTYYSALNQDNLFPDTTIVYNYRENSWALWSETFTTYGLFKASSGDTWQTYFTPWENWAIFWEDLGIDRFSDPIVAGGTPQGYVMLKWSQSSYNQASMFIQGVTVNANLTATIVSPNHNLQDGMYIGFWSGVPSSGVNIQSFNAQVTVVDANTFTATFGADGAPGTIVPGVWEMSVVDQINVISKQFQFDWSLNMKTRIGAQKYFLDSTTEGEFTVNIYGSQSTVSLNNPNTFPNVISSNVVRTRPDNSLGLNDNVQSQDQIWHRLACSAIGDTVQLQFTMSFSQMMNRDISTANWVLYSTVLDLYPSRMLA